MLKQSFITLAVAAALATACNSKNTDARGVNANAGPRPQDSATANSAAAAADRAAQGAATRASDLSVTDQQFVQKAMAGGRKEVELGRLAQQHASSDAVKQLGQRIADDHERANRELESMLSGSDVARTSATSENDNDRSKLEKMSGAAFDRAYVQQMIDDHQTDITEFERAAQSSNQTVRAFAEKTIPTLRQHLQQARDAQATIGK
jgi:putative membrane protein